MAWWVYKCNSKEHQGAYRGDWCDFFDGTDDDWESSKLVPELDRLKVGDYIIAYQTRGFLR